MRTTIYLLTIILFVLTSCEKGTVTGELTSWSKISIDFEGPVCNELSNPNPFTDYRMDVSFTSPTGETFNVPGFFMVSADVAESSLDEGSLWRVNFSPGEVGTWKYQVSFVAGKHIAAKLSGGESAGYFDGAKGSFEIVEGEYADDKDFRNDGKLEYVGEHFMQFRGSKEYFIKGGANSPEVLLEYAEFDDTPSKRTYPKHIKDWNEGDPIWKGSQGKGIIGVMNYLASLDMNSYYFLSMNAYGDGKKAWPWIHQDSIFRYDCSKLAQWDILFQHMNRKGILVNMILTETENEAYFEQMELGTAEGFADSHKIYYREMVARFGYLNAISYSIGEENGWHDKRKFQIANSDQQRKDFADYLRKLTYYEDFIGVHNGPSWDKHIFPALYGHKSYSGPSFQWDFGKGIYNEILSQRTKSDSVGHKWVVNFDEPYVDPEMRELDQWRTDNVWPTFMAGGAGIELYIGKGFDLKVQDFHPYEKHYKTMSVATNFFKKHVPFYEMEPDSSLIENGWTLRKGSDEYLFYLPEGGTLKADLPKQKYTVQWFDPIKGGALQNGSKVEVAGNDGIELGIAPGNIDQDWVCLVKKK